MIQFEGMSDRELVVLRYEVRTKGKDETDRQFLRDIDAELKRRAAAK